MQYDFNRAARIDSCKRRDIFGVETSVPTVQASGPKCPLLLPSRSILRTNGICIKCYRRLILRDRARSFVVFRQAAGSGDGEAHRRRARRSLSTIDRHRAVTGVGCQGKKVLQFAFCLHSVIRGDRISNGINSKSRCGDSREYRRLETTARYVHSNRRTRRDKTQRQADQEIGCESIGSLSGRLSLDAVLNRDPRDPREPQPDRVRERKNDPDHHRGQPDIIRPAQPHKPLSPRPNPAPTREQEQE